MTVAGFLLTTKGGIVATLCLVQLIMQTPQQSTENHSCLRIKRESTLNPKLSTCVCVGAPFCICLCARRTEDFATTLVVSLRTITD